MGSEPEDHGWSHVRDLQLSPNLSPAGDSHFRNYIMLFSFSDCLILTQLFWHWSYFKITSVFFLEILNCSFCARIREDVTKRYLTPWDQFHVSGEAEFSSLHYCSIFFKHLAEQKRQMEKSRCWAGLWGPSLDVSLPTVTVWATDTRAQFMFSFNIFITKKP